MRGLYRRVRKHGWAGLYVGAYGEAPAWAYSLGFDETLDQPEVVMFDVPRDIASGVLWQAFDDLKSGELRFEEGATWSMGEDHPPIWRKVHPSQISGVVGWLSLAQQRRFARTGQFSGLEAFQLVLPDPEGHYPWEPGYDEHLRPRQPALYLPENDPQAFDMPAPERVARRLIGERGWTIVPVDGARLCWAYSVGLTEHIGGPDVIAFGPDGAAAHDKLIEVQKHLRERTLDIEDGLRWRGLGYEVCWRQVHESQIEEYDWFPLAKAFRSTRGEPQAPVRIFQLFVPDIDGLYPWEIGCDREMRDLQPKLFQPFDLSVIRRHEFIA
ncbi:DUF4262 domain-containing protein [Phenylobacterium sp.]|jgi:hypothetical protein|uniref:DUF4262 domain-containing protein n=1 Tax=Phenylobacterium sp. TaxID=1871053 RepID=UPI0037C81BFB